MKKKLSMLLMMTLTASLCACSRAWTGAGEKMYIEPAQLTEEEQQLASLLGANAGQRIFDFVLDDAVQSIQVNSYRLIDGQWELEIGGGGQAFSDTSGRIALGFDKLTEGLRIAVQSEHSGDSTSYKREEDEEFTDMAYATSVLSNKTEITYEKEIPLAIQVVTSKNNIMLYAADYFECPEEYEKLGYESVYAITVRFSQNSAAYMSNN